MGLPVLLTAVFGLGALPKLLPPKPADGELNGPAPAVVLLVKPVATGIAGIGLTAGLGVVGSPPLFAPLSFSCVRPNAAMPNTAPMAIWNNPAPCSVSGFHCVIGVWVNVCKRLHRTGNSIMSNVQTNMYIQPIIGRHFEFIQSSFFCSLALFTSSDIVFAPICLLYYLTDSKIFF